MIMNTLEQPEKSDWLMMSLHVQVIVNRGDATDYAVAPPRDEQRYGGMLVEGVSSGVDQLPDVAT